MPFLGTDVYHMVHWFLVYSMLGWTNRGFIHGPMCPIYGVGALSVYFILRPLEGNWIALYFCGTILATTLEYITAIVMHKIFGSIWWDYTNKPFNYKGILCLESTIAWGFYTIILFMFLQKWVNGFVELYPRRIGVHIGIALIAYYMIDFIVSLMEAINVNPYQALKLCMNKEADKE